MSKNVVIGYDACYVYNESPVMPGWEVPESIKELQMVQSEKAPSVDIGLVWKGPKIVEQDIERLIGTISQYPGMETAYVIGMNTARTELRLGCPEQSGGGAHVEYENDACLPHGFLPVGTIHTHPAGCTTFSWPDIEVRRKTRGIHLVLPCANGRILSAHCEIITPNGRYEQDPKVLLGDANLQGEYKPYAPWVKVIGEQRQRVQETAKPREREARVSWPGEKDIWTNYRISIDTSVHNDDMPATDNSPKDHVLTDVDIVRALIDRIACDDSDGSVLCSIQEYIELKFEQMEEESWQCTAYTS